MQPMGAQNPYADPKRLYASEQQGMELANPTKKNNFWSPLNISLVAVASAVGLVLVTIAGYYAGTALHRQMEDKQAEGQLAVAKNNGKPGNQDAQARGDAARSILQKRKQKRGKGSKSSQGVVENSGEAAASEDTRAGSQRVKGEESAEELPEELRSYCEVDPQCRGIDCAPRHEACLKEPGFRGLRPTSDATRYKLPSSHIIFAYPFEAKRLKLGSGEYLAAGDNGLRIMKQASEDPLFLWSYDGQHVINPATKQCLQMVDDMDVALEPCDSTNANQRWLFDGHRFYSVPFLSKNQFKYLGYDAQNQFVILRQGDESDIYLQQQDPEVQVDQYRPPYAF